MEARRQLTSEKLKTIETRRLAQTQSLSTLKRAQLTSKENIRKASREKFENEFTYELIKAEMKLEALKSTAAATRSDQIEKMVAPAAEEESDNILSNFEKSASSTRLKQVRIVGEKKKMKIKLETR